MNAAALQHAGRRPHIAIMLPDVAVHLSAMTNTFFPHAGDLAMVNRKRGFLPQGNPPMSESLGHLRKRAYAQFRPEP